MCIVFCISRVSQARVIIIMIKLRMVFKKSEPILFNFFLGTLACSIVMIDDVRTFIFIYSRNVILHFEKKEKKYEGNFGSS